VPPHAPVAVGPITCYGPPCAFEPAWATLVLGEAPNRWMQQDLEHRGHHAVFREDLAELCGVTILDYYRCFARANLLATWPGKDKGGKGDAWPRELARARAEELLPHLGRFKRVVLLGRRVAAAMGCDGAPWFAWSGFGLFDGGAAVVAVAPHPSRTSRWWNDAGNVAQARTFWAGLAESILKPLGEERERRRGAAKEGA
jgi:hypothetical protein